MAPALTNGPDFPNLNGPHGIGVGWLFERRRQNKKKMGKKYDIYNAKAGRLIKALNAVLEPILMSARMHKQRAIRDKAFIGIFKVGWTLAKIRENGRPSSLENAHKSRDTEAKTLKKDTKMMKSSIKTKRFVADFDPVAWKYTSMIGSGEVDTRSTSPTVNRTVIMYKNCITALTTTEKIIARGTRRRARFTSSDMCRTPSKPTSGSVSFTNRKAKGYYTG